MNEAGENTTKFLRCFFREVQKGSSLPSYLIETNYAKKKVKIHRQLHFSLFHANLFIL